MTRTVEVEPAKYRHERQYRYDYTVERTGMRTVTQRETVRVPVTRYRTERIYVPQECHLAQVSYTEWVTRTRAYTTTETYTVEKSSTYWSTNKRGGDHQFTGRTRTIKVEPAEYKQQYLYEYEKTHEEWVWYYTARKQILIQPAQYEWQEYRKTTREVEARSAEMTPDRRIDETSPARVWVLVKQTGTDKKWLNEPENPQEVLTTKTAVNESATQRYIHPETGEVVSSDIYSSIKI